MKGGNPKILNSNQLSPDLCLEHRPFDPVVRADFEQIQFAAIFGDNQERGGHCYMGADITEFLDDAELEAIARRCADLRIADADARHRKGNIQP